MMPKYVVLEEFSDIQDGGHTYRVGDEFPHPGVLEVSEKRIAELASDNNKLGRAVIKAEVISDAVTVAETPKRKRRK